MLLSILTVLVGIVNFVCFIIVLIKLFQNEGVIKGILGLICAIYTFIWGWMKAKTLNITNVMWIWTACIIVNLILSFLFQMSAQ